MTGKNAIKLFENQKIRLYGMKMMKIGIFQ
jgi:hypothetical protein